MALGYRNCFNLFTSNLISDILVCKHDILSGMCPISLLATYIIESDIETNLSSINLSTFIIITPHNNVS